MGFNSFTFILLFLPILLVGWRFFNKLKKYTVADAFLVLMSLYFYYTFGAAFVGVLLASIAVNYGLSFIAQIFEKKKANRGAFTAIKIIGVTINLGLLFYLKYLGYFFDNVGVKEILMPVGISFFTFGQISFIVDRANGKAPHYSFLNYLLFTVYFPKLIQGPIAFHKEMIDQFEDRERRKYDPDQMARGIMSFIIGLSKKVLLADNLAKAVNYGFHYTYYLDTLTVTFVMIAYAFEIYLDFSGYCDMANGVSLMLGFELPVNFNSPFKATSSKELWQRWHMTLSRFFIKYVYIPLGGNRKGKIRTMINVLIVFVLSGLWHGAGWTYICWGLMQGILVVLDREKPLVKLPRWLGNALTFCLFVISLVFFGSQNMTYAGMMFKRFFVWTYPGFLFKTAENLAIPENYLIRQFLTQAGRGELVNWVYLGTLIILLVISAVITRMKNTAQIVSETKFEKKQIVGLVILFIWSFISLSNVSTFLYFQF